MGYCATGDGLLVLNGPLSEIDMDETSQLFEEVAYVHSDETPHIGLQLTFNDRYRSEEMDKWADDIAPYVMRGTVTFCGDDNAFWRFSFKDGISTLENSRIVFDLDPAIELSNYEKEQLLTDIINSVSGDLSTDGKPSVATFEPTGKTMRRLSDVLHRWSII